MIVIASAIFAAVLGAADCTPCHEEAAKALAGHPHANACATCHAVQPAHLESPSKETVTRVPKNDACLTCHESQRSRLLPAAVAHDAQHVTCAECHFTGHRVTRADKCGSCHPSQRAAFQRPYAHRDGRAPLACNECHRVHDERRSDRLALTSVSAACADCHMDVAGPHVYEHAPQQISGCSTCHESHGSVNPRLLKRASVTTLCLECHAGISATHDLTQAKYRACVSCHVAIHGSNRDANFFDR